MNIISGDTFSKPCCFLGQVFYNGTDAKRKFMIILIHLKGLRLSFCKLDTFIYNTIHFDRLGSEVSGVI